MSGEAQVPRPRSDRRSPISRFPPSVTIHRLALSHLRTFCLFFPSYFCSWATLRFFLWRASSLVGFDSVIELMPSSRMVTNFGRFLERKESDAGEEVTLPPSFPPPKTTLCRVITFNVYCSAFSMSKNRYISLLIRRILPFYCLRFCLLH